MQYRSGGKIGLKHQPAELALMPDTPERSPGYADKDADWNLMDESKEQ